MVVVVALIGYFAFGPTQAKEEPKVEPKPTAVEEKTAAPTPPPAPAVPPGRPGKTPDRPAPALSQEVLAEADAFYEKARKLNTEANQAQRSGDSARFNDLINDCWETLEQLDAALTVYNEWVDEAELYDWAIPGEYRALQQRYGRYDKLKGSVRRVRPNRR